MKIDVFLRLLQNVRRTSSGFLASCPAHDDKKPSLAICEKEDRLLIHCWSGCQTADILGAIGLDFKSLFVNRTDHPRTSNIRQPEPRHFHRWDWRKTCGELERVIQAVRERSERILEATIGLDAANATDAEFDEIWTHLGPAYMWLEKCDDLDDLLFLVQQRLRQEEREPARTSRQNWRETA